MYIHFILHNSIICNILCITSICLGKPVGNEIPGEHDTTRSNGMEYHVGKST